MSNHITITSINTHTHTTHQFGGQDGKHGRRECVGVPTAPLHHECAFGAALVHDVAVVVERGARAVKDRARGQAVGTKHAVGRSATVANGVPRLGERGTEVRVQPSAQCVARVGCDAERGARVFDPLGIQASAEKVVGRVVRSRKSELE